MAIGVIPNGMIGGEDLRSESGVLLDVLPEDKECCRHAVLLQKREQQWSGSRIRPVIKSKSASLSGTTYGRPKKLRTRM